MAKTSVTIDFIVGGFKSLKNKEPTMELFIGEEKYKNAETWANIAIKDMEPDEIMMITKKQITIKMTGFNIFTKEDK